MLSKRFAGNEMTFCEFKSFATGATEQAAAPQPQVEVAQVEEFAVSTPAAFEVEAQPEPTFLQEEGQNAPGSVSEVDLSEEWERMLVSQVNEAPADVSTDNETVEAIAAETPEEAGPGVFAEPVADERVSQEIAEPATSLQDAVDEIGFYLGQSMWKEAEDAIVRAEQKFPGVQKLETLKSKLSQLEALDEPVAEPEVEVSAVEMPEEVAPVEQEPIANVAAAGPITEQTIDTEAQPVVAGTEAGFDDFASDLEASLGEDFSFDHGKVAAAAPPLSAPPIAPVEMPAMAAAAAASTHTATVLPQVHAAAQPSPVVPVAVAPEVDASFSPLADLFAEFKEEVEGAATTQEDPETHYNLGMAFKEMGLLDEAIGELQKVCMAVDRGIPFQQTIQAYTWLAHCFIEKGVPQAAFKWYEKALKLPGDEETRTAIHYELATAYEQAGNRDSALSHFMEVYGSNIDYRDVADRIKGLRQ